MKRVVILGSGAAAVPVIDGFQNSDRYEVVGCIADDTDPSRLVLGVPIIGTMDRIESLRDEGLAAVIGVGGWTNNRARRRLFERALAAGVELVSDVHPSAVVSPSARLGVGCLVAEGVVIQGGVVLGSDVLVSPLTSIGHQSTIGDHCFLSTGVSIGGNVRIGPDVMVAMGAVIVSRVTVGAGALIAAGAVVVDDVPARTVVRRLPRNH